MPFELDENQKQSVNHPNSPLLVLAGPGSGKTRVITERIKFRIKSGLKPSENLILVQ